jgi:hypothetical protein
VSKIESIVVRYTFGKQKIMDDDSVSKPSAFFEIKEFYEQAEELGFNTRVHAQRKLTLTDQGLGLRLSTGTQLEDEPTKTKKKKSCYPVSKAKVVKHAFGSSVVQHMQKLKGSLAARTLIEELDENKAATKENKEPTTNENEILTPPFVVDLLTQQEDHSLEPPPEDWWATNGPDQWTRVFQARSTEGGMDFYVDQGALREVAGSLLKDLTTENSAKSAAEKCGREY